MRKTKEELWKRLKENPFLYELYNKIHKKRENALIVVTGKVQKGKSTVARKICRSLDPNFSVNKIVWRPEQFMDALTNNPERGTAINFEEIGTEAGGIPRRRWYAFNNMIINDVLQTFGFEGLIIVFTVPTTDYIDSNALKLVDYRVKVLEKDLRKKMNICKIYRTEYDDDLGKIYRHKIVNPITGRKVDLFYFKRCEDRKLERDYKKKEEEFKKGIQRNISKKLKRETRPSEEEDRIYNDAESCIIEFVRKSGKRMFIHKPSLEIKYDIGNRVAERVKARLEAKLLQDKEFRDKILKKIK